MYYSLKYTDDMPEWQGAYAKMWCIRIRPKYQGDEGIFRHELEHVRQFWQLAWIPPFLSWHGLLYRFCRRYRQWAEVQAYREQLRWSPAVDDPEHYIKEHFAPALADKYNFHLTEEEAEKLLRG